MSIEQLKKHIKDKTVTVGVIGLGYVGLPFLVEKAKVGLKCIGFDKSQRVVDTVNNGVSHIEDVKTEELKKIIDSGKAEATSDFARLAEADVIVICVPTPLDKNLSPDLSYVEAASRTISDSLRPGQLISLESTTYPGTTVDVICPILEKTGLKSGHDFFLAYSPERVDPGNKRYTTKNTNKVVGADDDASRELAEAFYKLAIEHVVPVSSTKIAEMVKVYENTYRSVNIALANEMALLCDKMDIDVWEMLEAAFTKPFGIMPFYPGPGVGGHCIPIDPHYLEWKAKEYNFNTRFINVAGEINRRMPRYVVDKAARLLNGYKKSINGSKILMIGMAYKKDLPDYRESPALDIYHLFDEFGANILYHDPYATEINDHGIEAKSVALTEELLRDVDLVVVTTDHSNIDFSWVCNEAKIVLDTRNACKNSGCDNVVKL